jgi:Flp pilus assembly protein TadG
MTKATLLDLLRDTRGAAAAEMVLVLPLLLVIMFGSVELGNYVLDEHTLLKSVRDGARYAARQPFSNYAGCGASASNVPASVSDNTKLIVRKGTLDSTDPDLLANWSDASTQFSVQMTCSTSAGGTTLGGIYFGNFTGTANVAPTVRVNARLKYRPVLGLFGFTGSGFYVDATDQAAVTGV